MNRENETASRRLYMMIAFFPALGFDTINLIHGKFTRSKNLPDLTSVDPNIEPEERLAASFAGPNMGARSSAVPRTARC